MFSFLKRFFGFDYPKETVAPYKVESQQAVAETVAETAPVIEQPVEQPKSKEVVPTPVKRGRKPRASAEVKVVKEKAVKTAKKPSTKKKKST